MGQSLGGANAISAVGNNSFEGIVGVVIEAAFSSYEDVAKDHVGSLVKPLGAVLVRDTHSPIQAVDKISPIPLIVIHGTADRVVPFYHGKRLYGKAKDPKELWAIKNGRHTEALTRYRKEVVPRLQKRLLAWVGAEPGD